MSKKKTLYLILLIILLIIILLFSIRLILPSQIDDISPEIACEKKLLEKAEIYYIIPKLNNKQISENKEWCNQILNTKKQLALHGVFHTYQEFKANKNQEYLNQGLTEFNNCFNQNPKRFKPPQLKISKQNKKLIKNNNLNLDIRFNQLFHKVYHCQDTGLFPNWLIDIF